MENPLLQMKESLIVLLKQLDPKVDVFAEEIELIKSEAGDHSKTYYFVDIIPTGSQTIDEYYTDMTVFIDVAYHDASEKNAVYLQKQMEIDAAIRPVLHFGDRYITINNSSSRVVDRILHYSFSLSFRVSREKTNEFEPMGELEMMITKEV